MTTYNTGNAIGSAAPKDLYDNSENLDELVNSPTKLTHPDRLGVSRKTWHGMEAEFDNSQDAREATFVATQQDKLDRFNTFIANSGYDFVGDYAAGIEITEYNQIVRDGSGEFWRLSGSTELPYTTTGAGLPESGAFIAVGDAALRQELAVGTATVSSSTGMQAVADALDQRIAVVVAATYSIPTDYPSYQAAIDDLSAVRPVNGEVIDLVGDAGWQPNENIVLQNCDYRHFRISHADSTVTINSAFSGIFLSGTNAAMPILNCLLDFSGTADVFVNAIRLFGSQMRIEPGCGAIGCYDQGMQALEASNVSADNTVWDDNVRVADNSGAVNMISSRGSFNGASVLNSGFYGIQAGVGGSVSFAAGDASGAGRHGIRATNNSFVNARSATANNCGESGIRAFQCSTVEARGAIVQGNLGAQALLAEQGSVINFQEGNADNASAIALEATKGSTISASECSAINAGTYAINAENSSKVDAPLSTLTGAGDIAIRAVFLSHINIQASNISGSATGVSTVLALSGSDINAPSCNADKPSGTVFLADTGSRINARASTAPNATVIAQIRRGSFIVVHDTVGGTSPGATNTLTEAGVIFKA